MIQFPAVSVDVSAPIGPLHFCGTSPFYTFYRPLHHNASFKLQLERPSGIICYVRADDAKAVRYTTLYVEGSN